MCNFTKDRCWIAKNNGKERGVIISSGGFFVAAKPLNLSSRKRSVLELNSMSQAEVERPTSTRVHARFGVPNPAARDTLDGAELSVRVRILTGLVMPSAVERKLHKTSGHAFHRGSQKQTKPRQELSLTQQSSGERIKQCQHLLSMHLMTDQRSQQQHCVPREHSVST